MIQKQSWTNVADNTNVQWLNTFCLYKGFKRRFSGIGFFIKSSAKIVDPPKIEYKGFKSVFNLKGDICRSLIIRTRYKSCSIEKISIQFFNNNTILLKKGNNVKSKYLFGPVPKLLNRKKFLLLFVNIIN